MAVVSLCLSLTVDLQVVFLICYYEHQKNRVSLMTPLLSVERGLTCAMMTPQRFLNAIAVVNVLGGSTMLYAPWCMQLCTIARSPALALRFSTFLLYYARNVVESNFLFCSVSVSKGKYT